MTKVRPPKYHIAPIRRLFRVFLFNVTEFILLISSWFSSSHKVIYCSNCVIVVVNIMSHCFVVSVVTVMANYELFIYNQDGLALDFTIALSSPGLFILQDCSRLQAHSPQNFA
jgi:hypothetical protein